MKLERRVYTSRDQKIGDLMIGVGLFVALNVVLGVIFGFLTALVSTALPSYQPGINQTLNSVLTLGLSFLPFIIDIVIVIYFGLTRYWIALGMLAGFAVALLVVLILGAACFALIYGVTSASH